MLKTIEKWAIQRIIKKANNDLASIPEYVSIEESDIKNNFSSFNLGEFDRKILNYGFSTLGMIRQANVKGRLKRDIFQKIYLNPSGEILCCLGLLSIAGQNVPYVEFLSEYESGKVVLSVILQEVSQRDATDHLKHKIHRFVTQYNIDIEEHYLLHIKCVSENSTGLGIKKFSKIEDGCILSKKLFLGDLIFTLHSIQGKRNNLSWLYRLAISESGFEVLQKEMEILIRDAQSKFPGFGL